VAKSKKDVRQLRILADAKDSRERKLHEDSESERKSESG
jgi:hypothetical protein